MSSCGSVQAVGHGPGGRDTPPARLDAARAAEVAETLQALTAPSRLLILSQLRQAPATVTELAAAAAMEASAVSHQLRLLRGMRLVKSRRDGRHIYYTLDDDHILDLFEQGLEHVQERSAARGAKRA